MPPAADSNASSSAQQPSNPWPRTPDGHYFLWKGWQLWRCTNPKLPEADRASLTKDLMAGRRAVAQANKVSEPRTKEGALRQARDQVQRAKEALGERGPVWWDEQDGPVLDCKHVKDTPYKDWAAQLSLEERTGRKRKRDTTPPPSEGSSSQAERASKRVTRSQSKKNKV